jgi:hypothetical protein
VIASGCLLEGGVAGLGIELGHGLFGLVTPLGDARSAWVSTHTAVTRRTMGA